MDRVLIKDLTLNNNNGSDQKTALITGGGGGIGSAIAKHFSSKGIKIVIVDIDSSVKSFAESLGGSFFECDLTDLPSIDKLMDQVGGVDILVNNAGMQYVESVENFPDEMWVRLIQVMLIAPFKLTKRVIPYMRSAQWGRIINISSIQGLVGSPYKSAYVSAKHGIVGLTKSVAQEVGEDGITVNAICPAFVRTKLVEEQIPGLMKNYNMTKQEVIENVMLKTAAIKRLIEPEEIANMAYFLASDEAGAMTGSAYNVDLGFTAS